jgi:hypothetical protein
VGVGDLRVERSMARHFAALEDPRSATQSRHKLIEITIAIAAALSGADGWVGVETFAKGQETWLRSFLELPGVRIEVASLWEEMCEGGVHSPVT